MKKCLLTIPKMLQQVLCTGLGSNIYAFKKLEVSRSV